MRPKKEPFGRILIRLKSNPSLTKSESALETAWYNYYQTKNYNETSEIFNENEK